MPWADTCTLSVPIFNTCSQVICIPSWWQLLEALEGLIFISCVKLSCKGYQLSSLDRWRSLPSNPKKVHHLYVNIAWRKHLNVRLNSRHCVSKSRMLFERNIKSIWTKLKFNLKKIRNGFGITSIESCHITQQWDTILFHYGIILAKLLHLRSLATHKSFLSRTCFK